MLWIGWSKLCGIYKVVLAKVVGMDRLEQIGGIYNVVLSGGSQGFVRGCEGRMGVLVKGGDKNSPENMLLSARPAG